LFSPPHALPKVIDFNHPWMLCPVALLRTREDSACELLISLFIVLIRFRFLFVGWLSVSIFVVPALFILQFLVSLIGFVS
jgi:hypothetical protein